MRENSLMIQARERVSAVDDASIGEHGQVTLARCPWLEAIGKKAIIVL
jgi:hypothetical protein